ncbi:hypothetical protein [Gluconobacter morbifer]|uniref:Uncharacterized protein n=1 Tax=Gluconobacter morbifer G707 TaxID=1088869 RepID=G6XLQ1_9PROT|nr:hypothetical protein [Gluconobacter morbifer]EHH67306.1 hypothetical protein GMO_23000 [Gluconobacter morbifer G707]
MEAIFNTLCNFILALLGFIVFGVAFVEMLVRQGLQSIGVQGAAQTIVLLLLLLGLLGLTLRVFGKLFVVLLLAALLVYFLHAIIGLPHQVPQPFQTPSGGTLSF